MQNYIIRLCDQIRPDKRSINNIFLFVILLMSFFLPQCTLLSEKKNLNIKTSISSGSLEVKVFIPNIMWNGGTLERFCMIILNKSTDILSIHTHHRSKF